ncbi:winged helix-turn-helix transcriptional regulator [Natronolimnobius sp. AArcel1]|uniref:winged helix-turn-helix domain-containing protein n=1 Tax=Natronolimnobius sp. AArcel1 TaxID=1679093 RepID=UPI0013E9B3C4|nr:winged helix-turn-helix domain-containing protein [Natronolimnobius sp. AArcel1]NGM71019.1 winged helix-turn-helix transcriptional regulator [Natronolimnobius sp. AArcel1]
MPLEWSRIADDGEDTGPSLETVVAVLEDDDCRQIIAVLEEPLTAEAIADAAGIALSSTYKKLDRLVDAGLVEKTTGARQGRKQTAHYITAVDRIAIGLEDDRSFRIDIDQSASLPFWLSQ